MDILFHSVVKLEDGTELFNVTSPHVLKRTLKFTDDEDGKGGKSPTGYIFEVLSITKGTASEYVGVGALGKRQKVTVDIVVRGQPAPPHVRFFPTVSEIMLQHRVYYLESLMGSLIQPVEKDLYG